MMRDEVQQQRGVEWLVGVAEGENVGLFLHK